jgi:hypothetical protein
MLTYFAALSGLMNLTEVIAYESAFIYDYLSYLIIVLVTLLVMGGCKSYFIQSNRLNRSKDILVHNLY